MRKPRLNSPLETQEYPQHVPAPQVGTSTYLVLLRNYWPLYSMVFLVGMENFIVSPFIPTMARTLGTSISAVATLAVAYSLTYAVTAPFFGYASDRIGRSPLLISGISLFAAGNLIVSFGNSLLILQIGRAITGLGGAMAGPTIWAILAATSADLRGRAIGLGMASFSTGQIVGIPVGGFIAGASTWRTAFAGIGVFAIPLLAFNYWKIVRRKKCGASHVQSAGPVISVWSPWLRKPVRLALCVTFLFHAASLASYTFVGTAFSIKYALSTQWLGFLGVLVGAGSVAGSFVAGSLNDLHPRHTARLPFIGALGVAFLIPITFSSVPIVLSLVTLFLWFFISGAFVTTQQTVLSRFGPDMRATALSWNNSIMHAGVGIGVTLMSVATAAGMSPSVVAILFSLGCAAAATFLRIAIRAS